MRSKLEESLKELDNDLINMGMTIEHAIGKAIVALREHDAELLKEVKQDEIMADEYEKKIENRAMRILISQQPVASDLRKVSTALKMITDMERIADQAVDITEIAQGFIDKPYIKKPDHIVRMAQEAVVMVSESIDAFVTRDLQLAYTVIEKDDIVDDLFITVRSELVDLITQNPQNGEQAVDFVMIAKYLERIADHAVNIAEWVIYNITGKHSNK